MCRAGKDTHAPLPFQSQIGDAVFGGAALFSPGLGMGLPLLAVGTLVGKLMPKAGAWMDTCQNSIRFGLECLGDLVVKPNITANCNFGVMGATGITGVFVL